MMESLKQKMLQLREHLERSTIRAALAEDKLSATKDRVETAEEVAGSLNRRIRNTQVELDMILASIADKEHRLNQTETACNKTEERNEELMEEDAKKMVKELNWNYRIKETNDIRTIVEMEYEAALKKSKVMDEKRKQLTQQEQDLSTQENTLSKQLEFLDEKLKKLQRERSKSTKENELEKKVTFLKQKCLDADLRQEAVDRKSQRLEKELLNLESEMDDIKTTKHEAQTELKRLLDVVNTV